MQQHAPAIAADPQLELVAVVDRERQHGDLPSFTSVQELIAAGIKVDAVAVCTPPIVRHRIAADAIAAGLHVMLEKPPAATLSQADDLAARAAAKKVTLFAAWHSREAASVDAARTWLADRQVKRVDIQWREDIRHWHPGQEWLLAAGGFGAFDPGINALSIATAILPEALCVSSASLHVPAGRAAPIRAEVALLHGEGAPVTCVFDILQTGQQVWTITVETDGGTLMLTEGGRLLQIDGKETAEGEEDEYPRLYRRFAQLIAAHGSDMDTRPLTLVADAFMVGEVVPAAAFQF